MVGVMSVCIRLLECRSLKEKRSIVKSILDRIKVRYHITIAEVASQDFHQEAVIEYAVVGNELRHIERVMQTILHEIERHDQIEVIATDHEVINIWQED